MLILLETSHKNNLVTTLSSWHTVVCFKHNAEKVAELGKKGVEVSVTGSIHYKKWQDRYSTEILADDIQFPGSRQEGQQATRNHEQQSGGRAAPSGAGFDDMDDELPPF